MVALADEQKHVSDADLAAIASAVCGIAVAARADAPGLHEAGYGFGV